RAAARPPHQGWPSSLWRFVRHAVGAVADTVASGDPAVLIEREHVDLAAHEQRELGFGGVPMRPEIRVRSRYHEETLHGIGGARVDVVVRAGARARRGARRELIEQRA